VGKPAFILCSYKKNNLHQMKSVIKMENENAKDLANLIEQLHVTEVQIILLKAKAICPINRWKENP